jgi:phage gp45-like
MSSIRRATLEKSNDDPKMQEIDANLSHGEKATGIEHAHPYGFSARPLPPKDKKRAEAIIVFPDGNRSQGVALMVSDRRHRLKGMKEGESAIHDDQDQKMHIQRDGVLVKAKTFKVDVNGKGSITIDKDGVITLKGSAIKFEQG